MNDKYDIFISYRRKGGDKYARTIQQALAKDYNVFLDFDELEDGKFDQRIIDAINSSSVFLLILSKGALDRCVNEDDWVRQEIFQAVESGCHIVPVTIIGDGFEGVPDCLPEKLRNAVGSLQFSRLDMESLFKESLAKLIKKRIMPFVQKEDTKTGAEIHIETDADCDLYRFKTFVTHLKANDDNVIYLSPGKYKLDFVSTQIPNIKCSKVYSLAPDITCDLIEITIKEEVDTELAHRRKEELKLQAEELCKKGYDFYKKRLYIEAFPYFKKSAEQGHAEAQFNLGFMYEKGQGVDQDKKQAAYWYRKAAEQGLAEAQCNLGVMYDEEEDYKQAVYWYRKAAEQGHAVAQNNLGVMYKYGKGVKRDYKQAVYWYRKAAEQGHARAQCNLGVMYEYGLGVEQDDKQAVYWYRKSAEQGDADAQFNLGVMYDEGQGVDQDFKQAVYWYRKAAEQGDAFAQEHLGVMYFEGQGVDKDFKQAVYWYRKAAAEQGHAVAQNNLGVMYEKGQGVERDYKQAVYWYRKAARWGDARAQNNLGDMYYEGQGVDQDFKQAVYWYRKAAEQGDAVAKKKLKELENKL